MEIFIFTGKGGLCGATQEASAAKLPHLVGPWRFLKKTRLSRERDINQAAALREIKAKGYHLVKFEPRNG